MLAGILLTLISLWYGQNHGLLPVEASEEAPMVDGLFNLMMTIGTGLFLLVVGVIVISAFKYRQRPVMTRTVLRFMAIFPGNPLDLDSRSHRNGSCGLQF